jgi:hypothetical protein
MLSHRHSHIACYHVISHNAEAVLLMLLSRKGKENRKKGAKMQIKR